MEVKNYATSQPLPEFATMQDPMVDPISNLRMHERTGRPLHQDETALVCFAFHV